MHFITIIDYLPQSYYGLLFLGALVLISYLVITDDRFLINRKILFLLLLVILGFISLYIDKAPYDIINDLFWYSLILNGSFIFHTLILDRIFHYCWKKNYDYLAFLVSRTSLLLSFSGLYYFIESKIGIYLWRLREYLEAFPVLHFIYNKFIQYIWRFFINFITLILLNFMIVFKNYELLLLGKTNNKFNKDLIFKLFINFIIFLYLSILLDVPRLYLIWIINSFIASFNIFEIKKIYLEVKSIKDKNLIEKLRYIYNKYFVYSYFTSQLHHYTYKRFKEELTAENFEKPYHTLFMFDLYRFFDPPCLLDPILFNNQLILEPYPFKYIYKFYPWMEMILAYSHIEIYETAFDPNNLLDEDFISIWHYTEEEVDTLLKDNELLIGLVRNLSLINRDYKGLKEIFPFYPKIVYDKALIKSYEPPKNDYW